MDNILLLSMERFSEELFVGIVGGVLTYVLLELIIHLLKKVLIPAYKNHIYDSVEVDGTWVGHNEENGIIFGFEFQISQVGHNISGKYISTDQYINTVEKSTITRYFTLVGKIKNNYLSLSYFPESKRNIGDGSFILQVLDNGNVLCGSMCYLKTSDGTTGATKGITLHRKP